MTNGEHSPQRGLRCGDKWLDLTHPVVMGVLNVTPDSFSDGGAFVAPEVAVARARQMVAEGAAIIDLGGESTRPDAAEVSAEQECRRILPVLEALVAELPVPVSVDTCKPAVMRAAIQAGAGMINDVMALTAPGALEAVAKADVPVCLMHMQGTPRTMQRAPHYNDVVAEVREYLRQRVVACEAAGIRRERLLVDPGFGFGKNLTHNLRLLRELNAFTELELPILAGLSRKSMLGRILDQPVDKRLNGSLAAAVIAAWQGAAIIRAHDVLATVEALRVTEAVRAAGETFSVSV